MVISLVTDGYKICHADQYPEGTEYIYSNFTPRDSRTGRDNIIFFGLQYFLINHMMDGWNSFFNKPKELAVKEHARIIKSYLGKCDTKRLEELHDIGYLPIRIEAAPEGTKVPIRCPAMVITNTRPEAYWLVNYLETILSANVWFPCTSATTAASYRQLLNQYADKTCDSRDHVKFQGHDFSFRGQTSLESACLSGAGHLLSFVGTDTIPALPWLEEYYGANVDKELVGCSVNASEHSVVCAGGMEDEIGTLRRLITEVYPEGIFSFVSDTWDYWGMLTETLPQLKDIILARKGTLVIRPDSGDPVKIVAGMTVSEIEEYESKPNAVPLTSAQIDGSIEVLYSIFGGTVNSKGYNVLDSHIGLIYGDSITLERANEICKRLEAKGFASSNVVFGIGSYTYQYVTRDTYGWAVKATHATIKGVGKNIMKSPKTDSGMKKSLCGKLRIEAGEKGLVVTDKQDESHLPAFNVVYEDGMITKYYTLEEIRENVERAID